MRQHAQFEGHPTGFHQVLGCGVHPLGAQPIAIALVRLLWLVAQTEERLDAARAPGTAHRVGHLFEAVRLGSRIVGLLRKGAVAAAIAAQVGERQKDVLGDADHIALAAHLALEGALEHRLAHQRVMQLRAEAIAGGALEAAALQRLFHETLRLGSRKRRLRGGRIHGSPGVGGSVRVPRSTRVRPHRRRPTLAAARDPCGARTRRRASLPSCAP